MFEFNTPTPEDMKDPEFMREALKEARRDAVKQRKHAEGIRDMILHEIISNAANAQQCASVCKLYHMFFGAMDYDDIAAGQEKLGDNVGMILMCAKAGWLHVVSALAAKGVAAGEDILDELLAEQQEGGE